MARTATAEVHSDDTNIDQKPDVPLNPKARESEVVVAANVVNKAYLDELAFNEEPVTVRLEQRSEENAASTIEIWNNGKGCEIWDESNKRWMEITHVPLG